MQAQIWFPTSGGKSPRRVPHLRNNFGQRARVVVFGSFMGGVHVLNELLLGEMADRVNVVGIATDDLTQPFTNAKVRLWKNPHTHNDEMMVRRVAALYEIPVFAGRVKSPEFFTLMRDDWQPDLCLMATFGQKIPNAIIELPRFGFFNFHHSGPNWPSYPGPDPIATMQRDGRKDLVLTMHRVTELIDGGECFAQSHRVAIPPGINAIEMHRITWPQMSDFIREALERILEPDKLYPVENNSWMLHDESAGYQVGESVAC
jgi:methionyl-tRNA formyltransferase